MATNNPQQNVVLVLTTFPADGDAETFARALINERLAACVNILPPMRSVYTWRSQTETANERQLLIKTTTPRVPELEARVKALHPYDVPEFLVIAVLDGSNDYFSWVAGSA
jgi:periplasmic divalent cation tolerance protein